MYESLQEEAKSTQQLAFEQTTPINIDNREEEDPNLFDIPNEDVSDIEEDDPTEEENKVK